MLITLIIYVRSVSIDDKHCWLLDLLLSDPLQRAFVQFSIITTPFLIHSWPNWVLSARKKKRTHWSTALECDFLVGFFFIFLEEQRKFYRILERLYNYKKRYLRTICIIIKKIVLLRFIFWQVSSRTSEFPFHILIFFRMKVSRKNDIF
jgi:hypothetical protein